MSPVESKGSRVALRIRAEIFYVCGMPRAGICAEWSGVPPGRDFPDHLLGTWSLTPLTIRIETDPRWGRAQGELVGLEIILYAGYIFKRKGLHREKYSLCSGNKNIVKRKN